MTPLLQLAGLDMYGVHVPAGYMVTQLEWHGLDAAKGQPVDVVGGHGAVWVGPDYRPARPVTIQGYWLGDKADAGAAAAQLTALGAVESLVPLVVVEDERALTSLVSVRRVDVGKRGIGRRIDFAIDCLAPDPIRYGTPLAVTRKAVPVDGASWTITNEGTAEAPVGVRVEGPCDGVTVSDQDGVCLSLPVSIPAGSVVDFDATHGVGLLDGSPIFGLAPGARWPTVKPGGTSTVHVMCAGASAEAVACVTFASGWW